MINTMASKYFKIFWLNFREPKYAPQIPPINAMITYANMSLLKCIPLVTCPANPDNEFTKMNRALTAAVRFMSAHFNSNNIGDKMIPPPIPISPDKNPITAPIITDRNTLFFLISSTLIFAKNKNLIMGINNSKPRIFLYKLVSTVIIPPAYAIGIDASANGRNNLSLKWPPR